MKGKLFVLDGIDGTGKSTLAGVLHLFKSIFRITKRMIQNEKEMDKALRSEEDWDFDDEEELDVDYITDDIEDLFEIEDSKKTNKKQVDYFV
jgi:predicted ATPase